MTMLQAILRIMLLGAFVHAAQAGTLVQFHMYLGVNDYVGDIEVELYNEDKPITVQNFLNYLDAGYYENDFFHRCVPGFVLQGGGASTATPTSTNLFESFAYVPPVFGEITNEYYSGTIRSNTYGTLAMGLGSGPNTATSQFFFNLVDNSSELDNPTNYYCVFGQVLRGTNILNFFNELSQGDGVVNMEDFYGIDSATEFVTQLPVDYAGNVPPHYEDLIYTIITPLTLQFARQTNNAIQLSWNSINGLTNNIEYTANLTSSWLVLTNPVGTGSTMTATDTNQNSSRRFYRVHVLY
jgi:cyclophilin family peptidyl-prolyl cis-trans isomerase